MAGGVDSSWVWAIGLITFAFGIACGIAVAYLTLANSRRTRSLQDKCDALQQEFDDYRSKVGQHFLKTSELVQKMTDSYRDVYEHLASGSQSLCQEPVDTPRLDIPEHPTLESKTEQAVASKHAADSYPGKGTAELDEPDSDALLGDSPRVPTLDTEDTEDSSTRRTPSP